VNLAQGNGMTALALGGVPRRSGYGARAASGRRERERLQPPAAVTPLLIASKSGNAAMIGLLLKSGADAKSGELAGTTPLMLAAASGKSRRGAGCC